MKKSSHVLPTITQLQKTFIPIRGIWNVIQLGVKIHQNMGVYLKRRFEMRNTNKCHRRNHRCGLNANEELFLKKCLLKCFKEFGESALLKTVICFIRWICSRYFTQPWAPTTAFQSQGAWPDRSMREGHWRFYGYCCGLHALIGWYMSVLLNSGPVFHLHNRWFVLCWVAQTALIKWQTLSPKTSGRLHISGVKLL